MTCCTPPVAASQTFSSFRLLPSAGIPAEASHFASDDSLRPSERCGSDSVRISRWPPRSQSLISHVFPGGRFGSKDDTASTFPSLETDRCFSMAVSGSRVAARASDLAASAAGV
jgi:hypothetical protein